MGKQLFRLGYTGRKIDELLALVKKHAVTVVVDVRYTPRSRWVPAYNKSRLAESLSTIKVGYVHLKELGNQEKDDPAMKWFQAHIAAGGTGLLSPLLKEIDAPGARVLVLCRCPQMEECHAKHICTEVLKLPEHRDLQVVAL